jgi:hypothetical protein
MPEDENVYKSLLKSLIERKILASEGDGFCRSESVTVKNSYPKR